MILSVLIFNREMSDQDCITLTHQDNGHDIMCVIFNREMSDQDCITLTHQDNKHDVMFIDL
jgi:hypothetical protein